MNQNAAICWINGSFLPASEAKVSVLDHGLLYGDGVFEGIRFYNRAMFRLPPHLLRLRCSAAALRLAVPYTEAQLQLALQDLVHRFGEPDGYLRLLVTRGEGPLGLDPGQCGRPNVIAIADHIRLVSEERRRQGVRVVIASTRRLPPDGLDPRIKSLNYLNHILARMEATQAGADEAILLNREGHVTEGTADNVFIARGGRLLTPAVTDGALDGITRGVVLDLAREAGIPAAETTLSPYDLYTADECFLTGTGAELIPVREIDGRILGSGPGPLFTLLLDRFRDLIARETATPAAAATARKPALT